MEKILKGKNIVITGAEKGLGLAMAEGLSKAGGNIIALGRSDQSELKKIVEANKTRFVGIKIDLLDFDQIDDTVDKIVAEVGTIDVLINNAGITPINTAEDYTIDDFDRVMGLNLKSVFILSQKIARHMIEKGKGKIVNIGSIQSLVGGIDVSAYVATKHGISGFTKAWANEWGKKGLNINAIAPGFMVTKNTEKLRQNKKAVEIITDRIP